VKGLYIHIPFCRKKCAYCGFYSVTESYELQQKYFRAMVRDLKSREKRRYETMYIGGGTPSIANLDMLAAYIDIVSVMNHSSFKEITIEANPESVTEEFLEMVHNYRFTRISLGCQSTSDKVLAKLTRVHSADNIFRSAELIRKHCPGISLNMDMIYDIPGVASETTYRTIKDITGLNPDHISAYSYSFDTEYLKDEADEDDTTDFMLVRDTLEDAGYLKYEISNFAKEGHKSLHNINYWNLGDYDGIGASAWSLTNFDSRRELKGKTDNIGDYIKRPIGFLETEVTQEPHKSLENLVFGLRITNGVDFDQIFSKSDAEIKEKLYNSLVVMEEKGLIKWEDSQVSLTRSGELLLDSVQSHLWSLLP